MTKKLPQSKIKNKILTIIDIFFADGKQTWIRVSSILSALFWTWLELSFIVFFFTFAYGFTGYILGGNYPSSFQALKDNKDLIKIFIKIIPILIFAFRVPIHYEKEIKKRE